MKLTEFENKKSAKKLTEEIGANNTTGFLTEDLVKIEEQDQDGTWSEAHSAEQLLETMDSWLQ